MMDIQFFFRRKEKQEKEEEINNEVEKIEKEIMKRKLWLKRMRRLRKKINDEI